MVLRYFGIRVKDLEQSTKFYTDVVGLKKLRQGRMYHGGKWVLLEDPRSHQRLELNWYPEDSPYATPYKAGEELDHIGFRVQDPSSTFDKIVSKGADPAFVPSDKNGVEGIFYVKDPNGIWLEFFG
jgi:lactoylglutathione lyase